MTKSKKAAEFTSDTHYEGKKKAYLDVDRIVNEGLSGGSVHMREESSNIEQSMDLVKEEPPAEQG
ncbi:hypothetical protein FZC84_09965 [Rossellomorea vietnamensis]|uniref:Uncharacterized protein n=1 Tax=Rossellomorea vietnamensis TaxID=218284 RepID=A0A5D4MCZ8_9BACI|nr:MULTISPECIES: hypothetical protein [Bacillaceae]TYR99552.1 hypothetical protein FZC84_09965 [Rossellomorea vietnamensis]